VHRYILSNIFLRACVHNRHVSSDNFPYRIIKHIHQNIPDYLNLTPQLYPHCPNIPIPKNTNLFEILMSDLDPDSCSAEIRSKRVFDECKAKAKELRGIRQIQEIQRIRRFINIWDRCRLQDYHHSIIANRCTKLIAEAMDAGVQQIVLYPNELLSTDEESEAFMYIAEHGYKDNVVSLLAALRNKYPEPYFKVQMRFGKKRGIHICWRDDTIGR
jgi:hypothetical protein